MRIITLGTGAGRPTLKRSSSAVGLEYEGETFLFDCGEGTQLQLMKTPFKWGKLKAVFIGHLHGDHVNGLPGLLGTLSLSDREAGLQVFGPTGIRRFLNVFMECQGMGLRYPLEVIEIKKPGVIFRGKKYQVESHPLSHSIECWGYRFCENERPGHFDGEKAEREGVPRGPVRTQLIAGEKVTLEDGRVLNPEDFVGPSRPGRTAAYCLDTRPCDGALKLAQGTDLFIYEATFEEKSKEEANDWGHSTAADGARIAKEAGAGHLILTHISQRYLDTSVLLSEAQAIFPRVSIAKDLDIFEI